MMFGTDRSAIGIRSATQSTEPSRGGVVPGRRYAKVRGESKGRTIEIIRWSDQRAKWQIRTVQPDGSLGRTTHMMVENLRNDYRPVND